VEKIVANRLTPRNAKTGRSRYEEKRLPLKPFKPFLLTSPFIQRMIKPKTNKRATIIFGSAKASWESGKITNGKRKTKTVINLSIQV